MIEELHRQVDRAVAPLAERHAERLQCHRGCSACCIDDVTVFEVEADLIRARHPDLLRDGDPHPVGRCAFLDSAGACRIYAERPYVCRTQGLPLRWLEENAAGEIVEERSICELNETGEPLQVLAEEACWQLGPVEDQMIRLQAEQDGSGTSRVALRALFGGRG